MLLVKEKYKKYRSISHFYLKALLLFLVWIAFYKSWLLDYNAIDTRFIQAQASLANVLLDMMGFETQVMQDYRGYPAAITWQHNDLIYIDHNCSSMSLIAVFAGFILAVSSRGYTKHKLWFVPAGIMVVVFLNIMRIAALTLIQWYSPRHLDFNHKYTFVAIVYGAIIYMWYIWLKKTKEIPSNS